MDAVINSMTEAEQSLIRDTDRARLVALEEDALLDLHARVRRARNKYVKLYRRQASAKVQEHGGRGIARPKNTRNTAKAEVFEDALARVSRRLAVVARQSAAQLKAERLAAARGETPPAPTGSRRRRTAATVAPRQASGAVTKSAAAKKREASTLAAGAQRQAKRDARRSGTPR